MTPAKVVPMYKKKGKRDKNKYRSASVLSNASKLNESSMQEQMSGDSVKLLSEFEWRFPQGSNAQRCLLVLIKNHLFLFELIFRKRTKFGSVSTDFFSIHCGVLQGSILGLLLHVIFTTDLFHINDNLNYAIYANDATHDVSRFSFAKFIDFLQLKKMFAWFKQNGLIANSGKRLFC